MVIMFIFRDKAHLQPLYCHNIGPCFALVDNDKIGDANKPYALKMNFILILSCKQEMPVELSNSLLLRDKRSLYVSLSFSYHVFTLLIFS